MKVNPDILIVVMLALSAFAWFVGVVMGFDLGRKAERSDQKDRLRRLGVPESIIQDEKESPNER